MRIYDGAIVEDGASGAYKRPVHVPADSGWKQKSDNVVVNRLFLQAGVCNAPNALS